MSRRVIKSVKSDADVFSPFEYPRLNADSSTGTESAEPDCAAFSRNSRAPAASPLLSISQALRPRFWATPATLTPKTEISANTTVFIEPSLPAG